MIARFLAKRYMFSNTPNLSVADQLALLENLKNAELCRDIDGMKSILKDIWDDFEKPPCIDFGDEKINAELLRYCGMFLSLYGNARNLVHYQARGKDLLIRAIEKFEELNIADKAAEANVGLAFSYWNTGEFYEAEIILSAVEKQFGENLLHPVYLQICINRMMVYFAKREFDQARELIARIEPAIALSEDARLKSMFHNNAGMIYNKVQEFLKAEYHFKEAIRHAEKVNNHLFVAANLNNLSFLHNQCGDYQKAFKYIDLSIQKFRDLENYGQLPHALDTKALIHLSCGEPENALRVINDAIEIFRKGEDYRGLTDALWTSVRCLFRLNRSEEALTVFIELERLARERIGEAAAEKFIKDLSAEIYIVRGLPLKEEVAAFKKSCVARALEKTGGNQDAAWKLLGLKNHQALSEILNRQFPELREELGISRRARRGSKKKQSAGECTVHLPNDKVRSERIITQLILKNHFSFSFNLGSEIIETFYFGQDLMRQFDVETDAVIVVVPVDHLVENQMVVVSHEDRFIIGRVRFDSGFPIVLGEDGFPIILDATNVKGEPVAYCPYADTRKETMVFNRLKRYDC